VPWDFAKVSRLDELRDLVMHQWVAGPLYKRYANSLDLAGDERVLEFGCGSGALSRYLARRLSKGGRLVCLDTSEPWVNVAHRRLQRFDNIEFVLGDVLELDIGEGTFDAVVIHFALHEVDSRCRGDIVRTLARWLKDDGRLFIREPIKEDHGIPMREIRRLMADAGFRELSFEEHKPLLLPPMCVGVFGKTG